MRIKVLANVFVATSVLLGLGGITARAQTHTVNLPPSADTFLNINTDVNGALDTLNRFIKPLYAVQWFLRLVPKPLTRAHPRLFLAVVLVGCRQSRTDVISQSLHDVLRQTHVLAFGFGHDVRKDIFDNLPVCSLDVLASQRQ